jgi:GxxExxY protein
MEQDLNKTTEVIIGKAIEVHRHLGPGLLESAYESCLLYELLQVGLNVEQQKSLPIRYKGVEIDCGYRIDLLVEEIIIVELKSVEKVLPVHKSQLLSYLRLSNLNLGLLINFNVSILKDGISRIANNLSSSAISASSALKK